MSEWTPFPITPRGELGFGEATCRDPLGSPSSTPISLLPRDSAPKGSGSTSSAAELGVEGPRLGRGMTSWVLSHGGRALARGGLKAEHCLPKGPLKEALGDRVLAGSRGRASRRRARGGWRSLKVPFLGAGGTDTKHAVLVVGTWEGSRCRPWRGHSFQLELERTALGAGRRKHLKGADQGRGAPGSRAGALTRPSPAPSCS